MHMKSDYRLNLEIETTVWYLSIAVEHELLSIIRRVWSNALVILLFTEVSLNDSQGYFVNSFTLVLL